MPGQITSRLGTGLLVLVAGLVLTACGTVQGTGRQQLLLTSQEQEREMGIQAYQQIMADEVRSDDARLNGIVERVGERLAAVAPERSYEWEFNLVVDDTPNAFALPGGKVAIHTGILPYCRTEAGLAAVMGHEIAHVIARHGGERMSHGMIAGMASTALATVLQANEVDPTQQNLYLGAFGLGTQIGVMLPYSRKHESEADYLGLRYMARAGYDPREAVDFWQRFSELTSGTPEFLSTHPHSDTRAEDLEDAMAEALEIYRQSDPQYGSGVNLLPGADQADG